MALCLVLERHLKDDWSTGTPASHPGCLDGLGLICSCVSQEEVKCSAFESGASNVTKFEEEKTLHSIIYYPRTDLGLHPDALEEI